MAQALASVDAAIAWFGARGVRALSTDSRSEEPHV